MDFKKPFNKINDQRIHLATFQTNDGLLETYPLGSFTFEYFLYFEMDFKNIYTQNTNNPNIFFSEIDENKLADSIKSISTARGGHSSGFNFYESTSWKFLKYQKKQLPLYFLTHSVNYFNNVRWVFLTKITKPNIQSVSYTYPAATWSEREVQDMFNVSFSTLKDTRRLLLEYKTARGVLNTKYKLTGLPKYSTYFDLYYV